MSDPFHTEYRALDPVEQGRVKEIKWLAAALYGVIESCTWPMDQGAVASNMREIALAKTKLEEAVMWAVKGITK